MSTPEQVSPSDRMWRTLVAVVQVTRLRLIFRLPGAVGDDHYHVPRAQLPVEVNAALSLGAEYLHVRTNLGQEDGDLRRFSDWEPR